jgi:hypothetical protein
MSVGSPRLLEPRDPFASVTAVSNERFPISNYAGTSGLAQAVAAAGAVGGEVIIDKDIQTLGNIDISGLTRLAITGRGSIDIAHASNDLFYYTATTNGIEINGPKITSSVTRTGGWVLRANSVYTVAARLQASRIANIEIEKQANGIWILPRYVRLENVLFHNPVAVTGNVAFKFGQTAATAVAQGVEAHLNNVRALGFDLYTETGASYPSRLSYGYVIEDCDAVYLTDCHALNVLKNCARLIGGGWGLHNHFFTNFVADSSRDESLVVLTGSGIMIWITFDQGWYGGGGAPAGGAAAAHGIHIDGTGPIDAIKIQNTRNRFNKGSGIYIDAATRADVLITGNQFSENGFGATSGDNHNIYVNVPSGAIGPTIIGNEDSPTYPSNGAGLRTSSTANRVIVRDNTFPGGWTYGVTPHDSFGNVTAAAISQQGLIEGVRPDTTTDNTSNVITLWQRTLRAGHLSRNGAVVRLRFAGTFFAGGNTKLINFDFGSNTQLLNPTTPAPASVQFACDIMVMRVSATTQMRTNTCTVGAVSQLAVTTITLTENLNADVVMKFTAQDLQNSAPANGTIVLRWASYEIWVPGT